MSWKHWAAAIAVIGVGIVLQVPGHPTGETRDHEHALETASLPPADAAGSIRTVTLEVTGMT